jgi:hypothetical protein
MGNRQKRYAFHSGATEPPEYTESAELDYISFLTENGLDR